MLSTKNSPKITRKKYLNFNRQNKIVYSVLAIITIFVNIGYSNDPEIPFINLAFILVLLFNLIVFIETKYVPSLYRIVKLDTMDSIELLGLIGTINCKDDLFGQSVDMAIFSVVNPQTLETTHQEIIVYDWQLEKVEKVK